MLFSISRINYDSNKIYMIFFMLFAWKFKLSFKRNYIKHLTYLNYNIYNIEAIEKKLIKRINCITIRKDDKDTANTVFYEATIDRSVTTYLNNLGEALFRVP